LPCWSTSSWPQTEVPDRCGPPLLLRNGRPGAGPPRALART
jgi:hypothetical protein